MEMGLYLDPHHLADYRGGTSAGPRCKLETVETCTNLDLDLPWPWPGRILHAHSIA